MQQFREFYLENEKGQVWNFQKKDDCFLFSPNGLGYSKTISYIKIGNDYTINSEELNQERFNRNNTFYRKLHRKCI